MPYLSCLTPEGAFYLFVNVGKTFTKKFHGEEIKNVDNLATLLLEQYRVALVPGQGFGAPDYVRISYALSLDNVRLGLDRIESFLQELS